MNRYLAVILLALFLGALPGEHSSPLGDPTTAKIVVLRGARLIDGTGQPPTENAVLIIEGGKIRKVGRQGVVEYPEGSKELNLEGKTIIPALIDLHTHLGLTQNGLASAPGSYSEENIQVQLRKLLAYGVGTIVSLGTDQELIYKLREEQEGGKLQGARFFTAGRGFGVVGGYPPGIAHPADVYRPANPEQARAQVRELASHHPDFVKMWVDDDFGRLPKMRPEVFHAIIEEAHRHHLRVLAHMFYLEDAKALVAAGVDALAHSVRDHSVNAELMQAMKAHRVLYIPTLVRDESTFAYAEGPKWLSDPFFRAGLAGDVLPTLENPAFKQRFGSNPDLEKYRTAFEMAKRNLKAMAEEGVTIGFGTDAGPPLRFQGYFEHRELQLMVESGLSPMQAIVAATGHAGEFLGADHNLGSLELGKQADFLVLDANPLDDIRNTEKLSAVWHAGQPVKAIAAP
jgi:imidazolonepropionase-like amidohydrolase